MIREGRGAMGGVMAPNGEFSNFLDYASAFNYEE